MCYIHWYHPGTNGEEMWEWVWDKPMPDSSDPNTPCTPRQIAEWVAEYKQDGWVAQIN